MRRRVGLAGLFTFACCALATLASSPARAADAPASDRLTIDLTATVAERCGVSPERIPISAARIDRAETLNFEFQIDCNTPFAIGVSSRHGALRLSTAADSQSATDEAGFSVEKDYDVALAVETDSGRLDAGSCNSRELTDGGDCPFYGAVAGEGLSSERRTAIHRTGTVVVSWQGEDASGPRRAAGTYQDTITIVVGARP